MKEKKTKVKSLKIDPVWPLWSTITVLKIYGLWHEGKYWKEYLMVYGFIFHLVFTFINILALVINTFLNKEDFGKFIYISLTEVAVSIKVGSMLIKSQEFVALKDRLITLYSSLQPGKYEEDFFEPQLRLISNVIKFYYALVVGSVSNVTFRPLFEPERVMPFNNWFFGLNWKNDTMAYGGLYFFEAFGQIAHASNNICWDMVLTFMIVSLTIHVRIVGDKLENIGWNKQDGRERENEFLRCVNYHREILKLQSDIVRTFAIPMFCQFLVSTGVICAGAFTLSQLSPLETPGLFLFFLFYVSSICLQIFIPCYFGNELIWQSAKLPMQIYKSNWYDGNVSNEYRRNMAFFILRVNKPIGINILHFFNLNLDAFEKVLNGAYSIFAVLKKQDM